MKGNEVDGAYTDPTVRQAISESISQTEADRMRGDKIREELYGVKYATPTPSITVGTQVRLTGVVTSPPSERDGAVAVRIGGAADTADTIFVVPSDLEVIRQPFKRGEVVYFEDHGIACVVLEDEKNGRMLLIEASEGKYATYVDAANYQRRPSRPKEER